MIVGIPLKKVGFHTKKGAKPHLMKKHIRRQNHNNNLGTKDVTEKKSNWNCRRISIKFQSKE